MGLREMIESGHFTTEQLEATGRDSRFRWIDAEDLIRMADKQEIAPELTQEDLE